MIPGKENKLLGDIVEDTIKVILPSIKPCAACGRRKNRLNRFHNNINGIFK